MAPGIQAQNPDRGRGTERPRTTGTGSAALGKCTSCSRFLICQPERLRCACGGLAHPGAWWLAPHCGCLSTQEGGSGAWFGTQTLTEG